MRELATKRSKVDENIVDVLNREEFFYADCICIDNEKPVKFEIRDNRVLIHEDIPIGELEIADIFQRFLSNIDGVSYGGGESSAHGSCGYFYKKTGEVLNWILMCLDSDPFVSVEKREDVVCFLSASGVVWAVPNDQIKQTRLER